MLKLKTDVLIFGGGIAGLWLACRLQQLNFQVILLEQGDLGGGQTIASQGMIHGGMKYSLAGAISKATETIAAMPQRWRDCLSGQGDIDLSAVKQLSDDYYMFSNAGLASKLQTFFASKALRGKIQQLTKPQQPEFFQHEQFKGQLYSLNELVVDTPSLVSTLATQLNTAANSQIIKTGDRPAQFQCQGDKVVAVTVATDDGETITITPQQLAFCAGKGNQALMQAWGQQPVAMQLRPVHQVMLKHDISQAVFAHAIAPALSPSPQLTVTSHTLTNSNQGIWYLGGELATSGIGLPTDIQIGNAKQKIEQFFPWLNLQHSHWASQQIDRAEPKHIQGLRPDDAFVKQQANVVVAWPTKLALAPSLVDKILALPSYQRLVPGAYNIEQNQIPPGASVASTLWQQHFG